MVQHILISLAYSVADELVANRATIHIKVLQVCLAARKSGQRHPTPQTKTIALYIKMHRIFHKRRATHLGDATLLLELRITRTPGINGTAVVAQIKRDIKAR